MGILVKCSALNVVTILLAALAMITAIIAITPPTWLTFKIFYSPCSEGKNCTIPTDLTQSGCTKKVADMLHNHTGYSGLWQRCVQKRRDGDGAPETVACYSIDSENPDGSSPLTAEIWVGRITFLLALVSWTVGIVFLIPWFSFDKKRQEQMFKISSASFFFMAVLIFSSLLIFSSGHRSYCTMWINKPKSLSVLELQEQSWGFQIAIVSIMLSVFAGGVSLLAAFKMEISAKDSLSSRQIEAIPGAATASTAAPSTSTTMTLNHNLTPTIRRTPTKSEDGDANFHSAFDSGLTA